MKHRAAFIWVNRTPCYQKFRRFEQLFHSGPQREGFNITSNHGNSQSSFDCTDAPPEQDLGGSSGLWTGAGVCFTVNPEGTHIIESDLCDNGKALSAELPGLEVDVNGEIGTRVCQVNVVCEGVWPITDRSGSCVNEVGGIANFYFDTDTQARVEVIEGFGAAGDACVGGGTATPAE